MISIVAKTMNTHLTSLKGGISSNPKGNDFLGNYPLEGIIGVSLESEDMNVLGFDDFDIANNIKRVSNGE